MATEYIPELGSLFLPPPAAGLALASELNVPVAADGHEFAALMKHYQQTDQTTDRYAVPCRAVDCSQLRTLNRLAQGRLEEHLAAATQNLTQANAPHYKRTTGYRDRAGDFVRDESPGQLMRTGWALDLAIAGPGKGFVLADGSYSRDGRVRLNHQGAPVSRHNGQPLQVCYAEGAPKDWSMKQLRITGEGKVYDSIREQYLGELIIDRQEGSRVAQGYVESANVNVPMAMTEFALQMRFIEAERGLYNANVSLDKEAVQAVRNAI